MEGSALNLVHVLYSTHLTHEDLVTVTNQENIIVLAQGPVSGKSLSLETDSSSLITMATIVFSMLKFTSGLKMRNWPEMAFTIVTLSQAERFLTEHSAEFSRLKLRSFWP